MHTILFDLDGTLTDPAEGIIGSVLHALQALGGAIPDQTELRGCIGPPLRSSFQRLLATDDPELVERAVGHYRERFASVGIFENRLYDGIAETLAALRGTGARLYVATSKPQPFAERIIEHFGLDGEFEGIYGAALDASLDDKRVLVRELMRREGIESEGTWMIGDRSHDVIAARSNDIGAIGVLYGYGTRQELEDAGAEMIAESPGEILELLRHR